MLRRPTALIAILAVTALTLVGCGTSGGDDASDSKATTTTAKTSENGGDESGDDTTTTTEDKDSGDVKISADGQAYVDSIVESMKSDEDTPLSDEQANCFGARFVKVIGVDRLKEAGVTPENLASEDSMDFTDLKLSEAEGNKVYDQFGACDIDLREEMMKSMSSDEDMTPAAKACMEGVLTDENLRKLMVVIMTKGDDAAEDDPALSGFMGGLMGCAFMSMGSDGTTTGD